jgi:glyoxylase-like metal-dependent hydrolase (beta-lactamase superfamily II)
MTSAAGFTKGLHELGNGHYAYLQPDGSWGWSNAGLITDAGQSILVDTLFDCKLTAEMLAEMRRATPAAQQIDILINSHSNGDHTFGNRLVEGARIVASKTAAEEMIVAGPESIVNVMRNAPNMGRAGRFLQRVFAPFDFEGIGDMPLPTETFERELTLQVGAKQVNLIEVGPAHTGGDILVHVPEDRIIYVADVLFVGGHPVIWAGPTSNWIAALDLILGLDVEVIVSGHGPLASKKDVQNLKEYFEFLLRECKARFDSGVSAKDAAREFAEGPYGKWAEPERLIINTMAIYAELSDGAVKFANPAERFDVIAEFDEIIRGTAV